MPEADRKALPHVSVTGRIVNHRDRIVGSWRTPKPSGLPPNCVEVHLTDNCNADCPFCFYSSGSLKISRKLDDTVVLRLCREFCEMGVKSVVFSGGGEPTLHSSFPAAVEILRKGDVEVGVITNGLFSKPEVIGALRACTWVKFSIHTYRSEVYPNVMGGNAAAFALANRNICTAVAERTMTNRIGVGCVITKWTDTDEHILGFFDHFARAGVDYVLYKDCIGHPKATMTSRQREEFAALQTPLKDRAKLTGVYTNYHTFVRDFVQTRKVFCGKCPIVWDGLVCQIGATGEVFSCLPIMQQGQPTNSFGNCHKHSFKEIWSGLARQRWLLGQDDSRCPACRYERMFATMNRIVDGQISSGVVSQDLHWKFI